MSALRDALDEVWRCLLRNVINCTSVSVRVVQGCGHQTGIAFTRRTEAMTTQHHTSFARRIIGSTQRIFRSSHSDNLLAPAHIDARTARNIGINLIDLR
jgi:hypothetical protein